jgi:biotin carboxyl carrier protein
MVCEKIQEFQMKKYYVNVNGIENKKEIEILDDKTFLYKGNTLEYDVRYHSESIISLRINGNNYIAKVEKNMDPENNHTDTVFHVDINSEAFDVICKSELDVLTEKFSGGKSDSKFKNDVHSPMPGAIVKLNVKEGDLVNKGDVLLVLEAMKMENEIKAVRDCRVKKIFIEEKSAVDKGQILIKLDSVENN